MKSLYEVKVDRYSDGYFVIAENFQQAKEKVEVYMVDHVNFNILDSDGSLFDTALRAMERNESIVKRLDRIAKGKSRLLEEEEKPELEDLGEHMASAMSAREKKCYKDHVLTGKAVVKEKDYSTVIECEKCNIRYEIQK
jgi:hypothetical protein